MNESIREPAGRTLSQRLLPFIRRDLNGRLISASIAALVIAGLCWCGIWAFTDLDSAEAQKTRVQLGLESPNQVCSVEGDTGDVRCTYDDRTQTRADEDWQRDVAVRGAILQELDVRIEATLANLEEAEAMLERERFDFHNAEFAGGDAHLDALLKLPDISPLQWRPFGDDNHRVFDLESAATYKSTRDRTTDDTRALLLTTIAEAKAQLASHAEAIADQRRRESDAAKLSTALVDRKSHLDQVPERFSVPNASKRWFEAGIARQLSRSAFELAQEHPTVFSDALANDAQIWDGGWDAGWAEGWAGAGAGAGAEGWQGTSSKREPPKVRYRSPITTATRLRLTGMVFLAIAAFVFVVVGPIVTATTTAREREAGTLPVLRMTGLSAGDLAMAMTIGPNVFAMTLGGILLLASIVLLGLTVSMAALLLPLGVLAVLTVATHLTAIGLGDALGQRVNSMVVGGLLGVGLLIPGMLGTALTSFDAAATGLLLGPLPPLWSNIASLSGIERLQLHFGSGMTTQMLGYSIVAQVLLGFVCLASWRRRVEQSWAPLFRPADGVLLALLSIGCSALTLFDISYHRNAPGTDPLDFDALNTLTFLSSAFLLPMLAWLLAASLRRPPRARAVADHIEVRRAFLRFQGFVVFTAALVGMTYFTVMHDSGLATEDSEVMWATLTQLLLAAETGVATLLWASRRREGRVRIASLGGAVVLMQLGAMLGTYSVEVRHVASENAAALPLLLNVDVSGYWLGFLILCWVAGLTLICTALLRRRDEKRAEAEAAASELDDDDDFGMPGRRLIH